MILTENSLYVDSASRQALVADKEKLANILLFNYFGFVSLYSLTSNAQQIKRYQADEGKLQLGNISDTNFDVSLAVKLAVDGGLLTSSQSAPFTKLLSLMKTHAVKGHEIDDDKIRELVKLAKLDTSHHPSQMLRGVVSDFMDGTINLAFLAYSVFKFVKKFPDITGEFYDMYMKGHYHKQYSNFMSGHGRCPRGVPQHLIKKTSNMTVVYNPNATTQGNTASTAPTQVTGTPATASTNGVSLNPTPTHNNAGQPLPTNSTPNVNQTTTPTQPKTPKAPKQNTPTLTQQAVTPSVQYFHNTEITEAWVKAHYRDDIQSLDSSIIDAKEIANMPIAQFVKSMIKVLENIDRFQQNIARDPMESLLVFDNISALMKGRPVRSGILDYFLIKYSVDIGRIAPITTDYYSGLSSRDDDYIYTSMYEKNYLIKYTQMLFDEDGFFRGSSPTNSGTNSEKLIINTVSQKMFGVDILKTSFFDSVQAIFNTKSIFSKYEVSGLINFIRYFFPITCSSGKSTVINLVDAIFNDNITITSSSGRYTYTYKSDISDDLKNKMKALADTFKFLDADFDGFSEYVGFDKDAIDVMTQILPILKVTEFKGIANAIISDWTKFVDADVIPTYKQVSHYCENYVFSKSEPLKNSMSTGSFVRKHIDPLSRLTQHPAYDTLITIFGILIKRFDFSVLPIDYYTIVLNNFAAYQKDNANGDETRADWNTIYEKSYAVIDIFLKRKDEKLIKYDSIEYLKYYGDEYAKAVGDYNARVLTSMIVEYASTKKSSDGDMLNSDILNSVIRVINLFHGEIDKFNSPLFTKAYNVLKDTFIESYRNAMPDDDKKTFDLYMIRRSIPLAVSNKDIMSKIESGDSDYVSSFAEVIQSSLADRSNDEDAALDIEIPDTVAKKYVENIITRNKYVNTKSGKNTYAESKNGGYSGSYGAMRSYYTATPESKLLSALNVSNKHVTPSDFKKNVTLTKLLDSYIDGYFLNDEVPDDEKAIDISVDFPKDMYTTYNNDGTFNSRLFAMVKALFVITPERQKALAPKIKVSGSKDNFEMLMLCMRDLTVVKNLFPEDSEDYSELTKESVMVLVPLVIKMLGTTSRTKVIRENALRSSEYLETVLSNLINLDFDIDNSVFADVDFAKLKRSLVKSRVINEISKTVFSDVINPDSKRYSVKDIGKALTWNGIDITSSIKVERSSKKDTITDVIKSVNSSVNQSVAVILPELPVKEVSRTTQEHVANSVVMVKKYANRRHGDIVPLIKREFDAEMKGNKEAFDQFLKENPRTEILEPAFHSCGTLAASFILRYGFAEITDTSIVTGKALGEGLYVTNVLDKSILYASDYGYSKGTGQRGYLLQFRAALGKRDVDYTYAGPPGAKSAGRGGDRIFLSEEWALKKPRQQALLLKAYEVATISNKRLQEIMTANGVK